MLLRFLFIAHSVLSLLLLASTAIISVALVYYNYHRFHSTPFPSNTEYMAFKYLTFNEFQNEIELLIIDLSSFIIFSNNVEVRMPWNLLNAFKTAT